MKYLPQPPTTGFYCSARVKTQPARNWISLATSQDDAPLPASSVCAPVVRAARASQLWLVQMDSPIMQHGAIYNPLSLTTAPKWATATSHTGVRWENLVFAQVFSKPDIWWRFVEVKNARRKHHKLWHAAAWKTSHIYLFLLLHNLCLFIFAAATKSWRAN